LEAIDYEFNRQTQLLEEGKQIVSETRRFDDNKKATIYMRDKAQVNEYHYMTEPNIPAVNIQSLIDSTNISTDELPQNIKSLLSSNGINESIINQLLDNYYLYKIFEIVNNKVQDIYLTITWVVTELQKLVNDNHHSIEEVNENTINRIIDMILSIKSGIINSKQAKTLIQHIYTSKKDVNELIKELGFVQITDEVYLEELLSKYIKDNPEMVKQYTERPERVEKFLIGMLMKNTNGQANPIAAKKVLDKLLK
ncbi:MAG: hypothetical protein LBV48_01305, partial [Mycoplasmataceae bacterium]|nr:hypothetical protein [Mycoplasmataceae bacterium]